MGAGDALMCTGEVKRMHEANGRPVHVVGIDNKPQWHDVFIGNPRIARSAVNGTQRLVNGAGIRPYIQAKNSIKWYWREYTPIPGELYLTDEELAFAAPYSGMVMVEPNIKANGHANKSWPFERWQVLVNEMRLTTFVQCGPEGARWLDGVDRVVTPSFRHACAVLSVSLAFVGTEGGLHHAAAALGIRAVVLWSHFIAPTITGYESQKNIRHAGVPCGSRVPCKECIASMAAIGVDEVMTAMEAA